MASSGMRLIICCRCCCCCCCGISGLLAVSCSSSRSMPVTARVLRQLSPSRSVSREFCKFPIAPNKQREKLTEAQRIIGAIRKPVAKPVFRCTMRKHTHALTV